MALDVPSKKSVRKAGEVLASSPEIDVAALDVLSKWRHIHAHPINTFQAYLRKKVKVLGFKNPIVAQRLKRTPSIIEKLRRFPEMRLDRMQDIGGLRVILSSIQDVLVLHRTIANSQTFRHQLVLPPKDYIQSPKSDGYRSLHQVIKYNSAGHPELNGLRVEIQLRTKLQHSWATAVETLGMIEKSSFKTGHGDEDTKRFFKLASALFSIDEGQPLLAEYSGKTSKEILSEFIELEGRLQILVKLEGLAISGNHIDSVMKDYSGYHVMQLFASDKLVRLQPFSELKDAESFYSARERETASDDSVSVVLINAGNLKEIKKAYPNYFLDTKAFLRNIARITKAIALKPDV